MKPINKKENQITFTANIEESLANAVRRFVNEIPILAINEIEIFKNDSPLYDETISHRMGLIPLKIDKSVNKKTTAQLKLNSKKPGTVYSGELAGKIKVVYDKIPITSLNKNQELEIVATVKDGKGKEHSRFSPGLMFYRNIFEIKIDKECPKKVVDACPKNILKLKDGKVVVSDNSKCDMCEACIEICKKQGKESIKIVPTDELIITLESFGQMNVKEIFKKSVDMLKKNLNEVSKKVGK